MKPITIASYDALAKARELGLLTTADVARASGLSMRVVDHYTRKGYITPVIAARGSGSAVLYAPEVLAQLAELCRRIEACPFHPHSGDRRATS